MKHFFPTRNKVKMFNECLLRCHKFSEELISKKQQRNEMVLNERTGGANFLKMGMQTQRNSSDLGTQRLDDRTKNIVLNKRVRSSVAELRVCTCSLRFSLDICQQRIYLSLRFSLYICQQRIYLSYSSCILMGVSCSIYNLKMFAGFASTCLQERAHSCVYSIKDSSM